MWTMPWNALWDLLVRYDGLDWVATVASLASIYYLGVLVGSIAGALLNALLFLLFLRGYRKWEARRDPSAFGPSA
jgi:hypothetical protein